MWSYYGGLKSQNVRNFGEMFAFFKATVKFSKFCSECFHRNTDQRCCVQMWNLADWKSVKSCVAYLTEKFRLVLQLSLLRWSRPNCQGQPPTNSECFRFNPNRFTFGGVIAERVNTAKTCRTRKVNPIFGWSLSSSRMNRTISVHRSNTELM